jgi:amidase
MSVTTTDLWRMSATDLAEAIRSRQMSSQEVIEAHLRRIEAVNPSVNAVTVVLGEQALEAAKAADRAVSRWRCSTAVPRRPLHGQREYRPRRYANDPGTQGAFGRVSCSGRPVVERLKAAGAIPIGRTNLATFTVRWHCESELWGATVNPWDRSRTPGASSGGEAAALATGMSPLGLGNDGLGSLR